MTIEASGYTEESYPVALSWTLHTGEYKSVFIRPEDNWTEWDTTLERFESKNRQDLLETGESALDVIRELDLDVEQGIIYVEDVEMMKLWLGRLFEAFDKEIPFDIRPIFDIIPDLDFNSLDEERRFLIDSNNLSPTSSEDQIMILQRIWKDFGHH